MPCSTNNNKPDCIILAGGRATRFNGIDKGLIQVAEKPLIEHVVTALKPSINKCIISANQNQHQYQAYSDTVVTDSKEYLHHGPLAGIASCLPFCKTKLVLVTTCDTPVLPDNLVKKLCSHIADNAICACEILGEIQPTLLLHKSCIASIESCLQSNKLSLTRWIASQNHTRLTFNTDPPTLLNVNTPAQLKRLAALLN